MRRLLVAGFLAFVAAPWPGHSQQRAITPEPDSAYATVGETSFGNLHGLNLGNYLEAPHEGDWNGGRLLQESDFALIHNAGFGLIRVPISWAAHVGPAPDYTIDPAFMSRIDWVVAQAEKNGLIAILDYHNDDALMKDPEWVHPNTDDRNIDVIQKLQQGNPNKSLVHFVAIWYQIAEHFKDAPPSIFFELLNEPNDKLDEAAWNALIGYTLPVIRASNPTRTIVVGPAYWNSIDALPKLVLPDSDRNLIVTFHFYDPFKFTHQGASWAQGSSAWLGTTWQGTPDEEKAMSTAFDTAAAWGTAHHRPMYLGEFGSYSKGDMASRARWTAAVVQNAKSRGIAWTYWEYNAGFGAYDPVAKQWRQPLLNALLQK
jgi:endoglucanase